MKQKDLYGNDIKMERAFSKAVGESKDSNQIEKRWNVQDMGEFIAVQINKADIPHIRLAFLDDFNKYSGQIVIPLVMEYSIGGYYFEDGGRHLRSISSKIRGILKQIERDYPVHTYNWEPPKAQYDDFGFDGYDGDYIMFDYDIV